MSDDMRTAYLFRYRDEDLFGVSLDRTGANLPRSTSTHDWMLCDEFQLDAEKPIASFGFHTGYYIWRDPCWTQRHWLPTTIPHQRNYRRPGSE
jgi:hypothetical protein